MSAPLALALFGLVLFAAGMFGLGWMCRGFKAGDDAARNSINSFEGK